MILEYDWSCLERKFAKCVANCTIDGVTKWRWIQTIGEDGYVYGTGGGNVIGCWKTEVEGQRSDDYPLVNFHYTPIPVGWIHTNKGVALLTRRHAGKIFKVGIDYDGYMMKHVIEPGYEDGSARFYNLEFMPEMGVYNRTLGNMHIFSPCLWSMRDSLQYLQQEIGFVEKFKCFLLDKAFHPLVKPYLGEQWQIVNCE